MTEDNFEIKLPQFEGPFDLLLFFIERDELEIHEIPIAKITNDFLGYIHHLNKLNMEVASEFIFVAATLMRIKAKMLLPRHDLAADDPDPKEDLIQKLIEYKKYKTICISLRDLEYERFRQEKRGNIQQDTTMASANSLPGEELSSLDLYKLVLVYSRVMERYHQKDQEVKHVVIPYPYTIENQKKAISALLEMNEKIDFTLLLAQSENKVQFVYNFMAMLEMLQQQLISIQIGLGYNNFQIKPKADELN
jgi:segregation and condensation protein A